MNGRLNGCEQDGIEHGDVAKPSREYVDVANGGQIETRVRLETRISRTEGGHQVGHHLWLITQRVAIDYE